MAVGVQVIGPGFSPIYIAVDHLQPGLNNRVDWMLLYLKEEWVQTSQLICSLVLKTIEQALQWTAD